MTPFKKKPYTDENEVKCWHYDHSKGKAVQGFNLLSCLYHVGDISIPVAFELIRKFLEYCDLKTRGRKRASPGILYLTCSDTTVTRALILTIYQQR